MSQLSVARRFSEATRRTVAGLEWKPDDNWDGRPRTEVPGLVSRMCLVGALLFFEGRGKGTGWQANPPPVSAARLYFGMDTTVVSPWTPELRELSEEFREAMRWFDGSEEQGTGEPDLAELPERLGVAE